jgi:hypothetical protein
VQLFNLTFSYRGLGRKKINSKNCKLGFHCKHLFFKYQVYDISEDYGNMYNSCISALAITQMISTAKTDILSVLLKFIPVVMEFHLVT